MKLLTEQETEQHIDSIFMEYKDLENGKFLNFEDLAFSYALKTKNSIVHASTFLYAFLAVSLRRIIFIRVYKTMHKIL